MLLSFSKYQGAGNDFILIDDRDAFFPCAASQIQNLCHRQYGIGADGLILLQSSSVADARMRIFNADGSEAEMCGNGIRCLFHFAHQLGCATAKAEIETAAALYSCYFSGDKVAVLLPMPTYVPELELVNSGVRHVVSFVDNDHPLDVEKRGKEIRFDVRFSPQGANVTFAQLIRNELRVRTYERGVEKETLACGTGAVAAAFMAMKKFSIASPVNILTSSNERLEVFQKENGMELVGPAREVFKGKIQI